MRLPRTASTLQFDSPFSSAARPSAALPWFSPAAVRALIAVGAVAVAAATAITPYILVLPIGCGALGLLFSSPSVRLAVLVFGGLATLESSGQITSAKLLYFAAAAAIVALAFLHVFSSSRPLLDRYGLMLVGAAVLALDLVYSLAVSVQQGRSTLSWFRDAVPYLLLVASPAVGFSIGRTARRSAITAVLVAAGTFAGASYIVQWFSNRQIGSLGINQIGLGSTMLIAGVFCYAVARGLSHEAAWRRWLVLAAFLAGSVGVTGSRTSLVLLAAVLGSIPAAIRQGYAGRIAGRFAGTAVLAVIATLLLALVTGVSLSYLATRVHLVTGGATSQVDGSAIERREETALALAIFQKHPWTGQGVGLQYHTVRINGEPRNSYTMDTGLLLLSKFGVAGVLVALAYMLGLRRTLQILPRDAPERTALVGLACVAVVALPLMLASEDKGFALVLTTLIALVVARDREILAAAATASDQSLS